jgi:glycosyltransferase involved in cell wall biosynthesis
MRVGFDLRTLQGHSRFRGIGRYVAMILKKISQIDKDNTYILYLFEGLDNPLSSLDLEKSFKYEIRYLKERVLPKKRIIGILFDEFRPAKVTNDNIDVFYQPDVSYGIPKGVSSILVFYDLIPLYFWHKNKFRRNLILYYKDEAINKLFRRRYLRTIRDYVKADRIISISRFSKKDLLKNYPEISKNKVSIVYLASDTVLNNKRFSGKSCPDEYILYVGGADLRKNINGLIKIFYELKEKHKELKLVLVGKEFNVQKEIRHYPWFHDVKDSRYFKDIIFKEYVDDIELISLYKGAKVFVFASKYEGFGLPILEAMSIGVPVVAFNNSSIPEVTGSSAILCDNNTEFVRAVSDLVSSPSHRKALIAKGIRQSKKFSWLRAAKQTLEVIEKEGNR